MRAAQNRRSLNNGFTLCRIRAHEASPQNFTFEDKEQEKPLNSPGDRLRYGSIGRLYDSSSLPYFELGLSSTGEPYIS
jgi:hypothetical protein